MKLANQVTSVELSNRLLELGVRKESQFYRDWTGAKEDEILIWENTDGDVCLDNVNCYTVAELLELAPASTSILKKTDIRGIASPRYYVETFEHYRNRDFSENPADALALMLIYLIENKLFTLRSPIDNPTSV